MITSLILSGIVIVLVAGVHGTHRDPKCPRHRGLPDGFVRAENRFKTRPMFRMDLRSALKGYIPNKQYRFRVQTTVRKHKFNDATVVIDPLDNKCGTGSWIIASESLYSPKDCPTVVTTQQKEPMGKAHFVWRAPSCGCVHFRVRVHVNATYYIEDETVHNGALARTVCPKPGTVEEPEMSTPKTTTEQPRRHIPLSRAERLSLLCDVTQSHEHDDVIEYDHFSTRRQISQLNLFELDRLSTAVQRRHLDVLNCCNQSEVQARLECFGDIRRVSIDTFCGTGEPDIPLATGTYHWIKKKEPTCCPQIGEQRYACFNQSLHDPEMQQDSHGDKHLTDELDDFDPVNFLEDYPTAGDMREKLIHNKEKETNPKRKEATRHTTDKSETNPDLEKADVRKHDAVKAVGGEKDIIETSAYDTTEASVKQTKTVVKNNRHDKGGDKEEHDAVKVVNGEQQVNESNEEGDSDHNINETNTADTTTEANVKHSTAGGSNDMDEEGDDKEERQVNNDDDDDGDDFKDKRRPVNDDKSSGQDLSRERALSSEECCRNGIDAGTKVYKTGFDGCFKMANRYQSYFMNWNRECDLNFVICCMRVIDGDVKSLNTLDLLTTLRISNHACKKEHSGNTSNLRHLDSKIRIPIKLKRLIRKQNKRSNLIKNSKFGENNTDIAISTLRISNHACRMEHSNETSKPHFDSKRRKTTKFNRLIRKQKKNKNLNLTKKSKFGENNTDRSKSRTKTFRRHKEVKERRKKHHEITTKSFLKLANQSKYKKWKRKLRVYRKQNAVSKT